MCKQQYKQHQVRSGKEAGSWWGPEWSLPKCEIPNRETFGKTTWSNVINMTHLLNGIFYLEYVWPKHKGRREVFINLCFITSKYLSLFTGKTYNTFIFNSPVQAQDGLCFHEAYSELPMHIFCCQWWLKSAQNSPCWKGPLANNMICSGKLTFTIQINWNLGIYDILGW